MLGMSDDTTVSYLISLANQAKSVDKLEQKIIGEEFLPAEDPSSRPFIQKLFSEFAAVEKTVAKPALQ